VLLLSQPVTASRGVVILAAGASQRMGTPKALLAWQGTTLLQFALAQARATGVDEIVVVLGPATRHLDGSLGNARVALNPDPATGRSTSIRTGTEMLSADVAAVIIQSVDQPCSAEVLDALFSATVGGADVAVPTYRGRRGHPICLSGRLLPELRTITEAEEGLRSVVRRHAHGLVEVPVESESVLWNLNDPAAYAAAQANGR
jgi:molybdenum cofactor cytidylyltransferase